jgi:hypothetical protein
VHSVAAAVILKITVYTVPSRDMVVTMTTVVMILRSEQRARLMASVRRNSNAWNALYEGTKLFAKHEPLDGGLYAVACGEDDARLLLFCARKNCPDATTNIESAMREAHKPAH